MKTQFKINDLTPIEYHEGVYFKRDDLYTPFNDIPELSGSKVRQMQLLIDSLLKRGEWNFKGIITYSSVHSPQALIVARIAYEYKIPCIIGVGVKEDELDIEKHPTLSFASKYKAEIVSIAGIGYNSALKKRSEYLSEKLNFFLIDFGINVEKHTYAVIRGIASQVQNLPNDIDNLIIPCGSGISMAGIMVGLKLFNKKVKRIIGIQISGYDRQKTINNILTQFKIEPNYEFIIDKTYPYSRLVKENINDNFDLNMCYESKALQYFQNHKKEMRISENDKSLFWCIGNNNFLYSVPKKDKKVNQSGVNISIEDFKMLVNPCSAEMINSYCLGECCRTSYLKLGHPLIVSLKDEFEKLKDITLGQSFSIDEERQILKPVDKTCPFQEKGTNFCGLHETDTKPFGCKIMPLTIKGNTIKVQKYFSKMVCQKTEYQNVQRVPFYHGFNQSLKAVFGEEETNRIVKEIESGNDDITVNISKENLQKIHQVKEIIGNITRISKHS